MSDKPYDEAYWGPAGPYPAARWGWECARGLRSAETGAPVNTGTKAVVRKISVGRKQHRGLASDDLQRRLEQ
jgi:hypothetical protein